MSGNNNSSPETSIHLHSRIHPSGLWEEYKKLVTLNRQLRQSLSKKDEEIRKLRGEPPSIITRFDSDRRKPKRRYKRDLGHRGPSLVVCADCGELKEVHGNYLCRRCYNRAYQRMYRKRFKPSGHKRSR